MQPINFTTNNWLSATAYTSSIVMTDGYPLKADQTGSPLDQMVLDHMGKSRKQTLFESFDSFTKSYIEAAIKHVNDQGYSGNYTYMSMTMEGLAISHRECVTFQEFCAELLSGLDLSEAGRRFYNTVNGRNPNFDVWEAASDEKVNVELQMIAQQLFTRRYLYFSGQTLRWASKDENEADFYYRHP